MAITASYDGPFDGVGFTVTVFCSNETSWDKRVPKVPFTHKVGPEPDFI